MQLQKCINGWVIITEEFGYIVEMIKAHLISGLA